MRPIGIGLAVALIAAAVIPASLTFAAKSAGGSVTDQQRKQGMEAAPAMIQASALPCTLSDARFIGQGKTKDGDKEVVSKFVEVACSEGTGFVFAAKEGQTPDVYDCLATASKDASGKDNTLKCALPANANPNAGVQAGITKAGNPCQVADAKYIGQNKSSAFYEAKCASGSGVVVLQALPRTTAAPEVLSCLAWEGMGKACELTTHDANLAPAKALATKANASCQVKDTRYVLTSKNGDDYYEFACADNSGFMVQANNKGEFVKTIPCAQADYVAGGCTLTNARQAQTEQASLYTKLAKKAGYDCDVAKYAVFPSAPAGAEAVEMSCGNRADGAVGIFYGDHASIYDCALAQLNGYRCSFTKPDAAYPKLTSQLKAKGKNTCTVSNARAIGTTAAGEGYLEVACSDGLPGWVLVYPKGGSDAKEVLACNQAAGIGGGCKLPGNTKG